MYSVNQTVYLDDGKKEVVGRVIQMSGSTKVLIEVPEKERRGVPYQMVVAVGELRHKAKEDRWRNQ